MKFILTLVCFLSALIPLFYVNAQSIRQPFTGVAQNLPAKIEAENYDIGGQGISYNDSDPLNQGYSFRTDGVDIEPCSEGGYDVGYTVAGEWLEYTVNTTMNTNFQLDLRTASTQSGSILRVYVDGVAAAKDITLPNTSEWQKWATTTINAIPFSSGKHILRLFVVVGGFNINYFNFSSIALVNKLPSVSISAPSNGTTFTAPASFSINANASDMDGEVIKVEFFDGQTLLGQASTAPYTYSWSNVPVGTYIISAKATDNVGGTSISTPITLTITNIVIPNQLPNVLLTSPLNNTQANAPFSILMSADATDSDGFITRVEFYSGSLLIGSDKTAPYSYIWNNAGAGVYTITAKAFDDQGAFKISATAVVSLVTTVTEGCLGIALYLENGGYKAGSKVQSGNNRYECKPWPYSSWCNGVSWAYAPGSGIYWADAWVISGSCNNTRSAEEIAKVNYSENIIVQPNPFLVSAALSIKVEQAGDVSIKLYDKTGRYIKTIEEGYLPEGRHHFSLSMEDEAPGLYFVKYITQRRSVMCKMIKGE